MIGSFQTEIFKLISVISKFVDNFALKVGDMILCSKIID